MNIHNNDKLKHAITLAIGVIALAFQQSALALGLGDILVKSHLGQPLKASVSVLSANELKDAACLRLGPNSDLSHVNFNLGAISGSAANLTITSNKLINDPIVNLSIIAGCDSTVKRDYVLLIDPPLSSQTNRIDSPVVVQKLDTSDNRSTTKSPEAQTQQIKKPAASPKKKKRSKQRTVAKKRKQTPVAVQQSRQVTQTNVARTPQTTSNTDKPRLSISGGNNITYAMTGLRLERHLRFIPDANAPVIDNVEIDDEITVMNNRLKHLQEQITKLQTQNDLLTSDNKLKTDQLLKVVSWQSKLSSLWPFVATLLLITGGYFGFQWLRSRETQRKNHHAEAIWASAQKQSDDKPKVNKSIMVAQEETAEEQKTITEEETTNEEDVFPDINFGLADSPSATMESTFESTREDEPDIILEDEQALSVLDHADVFLSHGRATLAIQLLQNHLLEHPKQSVTIWLFLLDLLQKENLQALYEEAATDCKLHFNIETTAFSAAGPDSNKETKRNSLEDFPHLTTGLEKVWNTPAAIVFLDDLIYNNRLEPRAGLPKGVVDELVLLRTMTLENTNSAEVIQLDAKKLAIIEEKEAMLESKKAEKLKAVADAEKLAKENAKIAAEAEAEANETDFEFTLVEK